MSKYAEDETILAGIRKEETPDDIVADMERASRRFSNRDSTALACRLKKALARERQDGARPTPKELTDWDWETTVAAWRYYEYGATIASATFPEEMVRRFFSIPDAWSEDAKMRIAMQFADTDHGRKGEEDWKICEAMDRKPWCKFYNFCKGWVHGFAQVRFRSDADKDEHVVAAFRCMETGRWYPVEKYLESPFLECFIPDEWVLEVARPEVEP